MAPSALPPDALSYRCDPSFFAFETTAELAVGYTVVGQPRAVEAMRFGIGMRRQGYNLYVSGPPGTGRRALVSHFLEARAAERPAPDDWCYVHNFEEPRQPRALSLPAGCAVGFREDMEKLVEQVTTALYAAFESEEYQVRRRTLREAAQEDEEAALEALQKRVRADELALLRTSSGFAIAPIHEGEVIDATKFQALPDAERERIQALIEQYQLELATILRQVPARQRQLSEHLQELDREVAEFAVRDLFDGICETYKALETVCAYLGEVKEDLVENVRTFLQQASSDDEDGHAADSPADRDAPFLRRYRINVVVDHSETTGAPVLYEDNPHYQNLIGQIEQIARMGTLVTDFNLIEGGALHKANGGYLVIEARKLLSQSFAWEGLKRALSSECIRIETPGEALGLISTVTLEPEPIPLFVKIVLVGEPGLYYMLDAQDPDFPELFKVFADFEERFDREGNQQHYARMLAHIADREEMHPLHREAVCRIIERSARLAGDAEKLSTHLQRITDLLREADFFAAEDGAEVIQADHVQRALDHQVFRADRIRERMYEQIQRETIFISTEGTQVGQINGLAVLQLGGFAFGKPNRITVRVRLGRGEVIDIEREVALSGPLHHKGVLILSGFLGSRYAQDHPLSLSASIVFEQSYGGVDGDSASSAELYALLSALAEVPLRQSLAVTGSVNQLGVVQPIGGVNEKIEGFFDICAARGLTGDQGVLIPAPNVKHLMLQPRVVEAVAAGQFHIYPVAHIDEGIELLTGLPAGTPDAEGIYPEGSVNRRVADRLVAFAERRRHFLRDE